MTLLNSLAALWSLGLLVVAVGVLLWFAYRICLRRMFRVRGIANARERRLMREAAQRGAGR